jgi:hypothetical protein
MPAVNGVHVTRRSIIIPTAIPDPFHTIGFIRLIFPQIQLQVVQGIGMDTILFFFRQDLKD